MKQDKLKVLKGVSCREIAIVKSTCNIDYLKSHIVNYNYVLNLPIELKYTHVVKDGTYYLIGHNKESMEESTIFNLLAKTDHVARQPHRRPFGGARMTWPMWDGKTKTTRDYWQSKSATLNKLFNSMHIRQYIYGTVGLGYIADELAVFVSYMITQEIAYKIVRDVVKSPYFTDVLVISWSTWLEWHRVIKDLNKQGRETVTAENDNYKLNIRSKYVIHKSRSGREVAK